MSQLLLEINRWMAEGILLAGAGSFLWGVVSVLLSPCHLASIPLIIGYVGGQNELVQGRRAAGYAVLFTTGLFITIAALGITCALMGRLLGDIGDWWTPLVGIVLLWVAFGMLGQAACSSSGSLIAKLRLKGASGAFVLGLAYGILSGACTFGFIAPILAVITMQDQVGRGILLITLFGIGHCLPIVLAGSSTAWVRNLLSKNGFHHASGVFRKGAGVLIGLMGVYFIARPFLPA